MLSDQKSRVGRYNRTPIVRATISSLIVLLEQARTNEVGNALAANIYGALALELSLKQFYLTFHENPPPSTHLLKQLWSGLPEVWRAEMDKRYQSRAIQPSDIRVFGLQVAGEPPEQPSEGLSLDLSTADGFFEAISNQFVQSRYVYEQVADENWTYVLCAKSPMLRMLRVMSEFYEERLKGAG